MIARRFIQFSIHLPNSDVTTRFSEVDSHIFKTEGKVLVAPGWLEVYGKSVLKADPETLPALSDADGNLPRQVFWIRSANTNKQGYLPDTRKPPCFPLWKALQARRG